MKVLKFGIVLAIAILFITAKAPPSPKDSLGGGCLEADILFITDWSGSIDGHQSQVVRAADAFINGFELSPNGVKIGIMSFSGSAQIDCPLTANKAQLDTVLFGLRFRVPGGDTKLNSALVNAPQLFNQSTIERDKTADMQIIIFMSDGDGTDNAAAITSAKTLKDQGVIIFAIGIGDIKDAPRKDLKNIASPDSYLEINYESLRKTLQGLDLCG